MTINPASYPFLSHWYEFNEVKFDSSTLKFRNLQSEFDRDPYRPAYDDGASGSPTFATVSGRQGMILNNDAFLSCRSMLLGEMTFFAVVEHTVTAGSLDIALMGAGDDTSVDDDWAVYFKNGLPNNRQANGNANGATNFGGTSGARLLTGVVDAEARRLAASTDGESLVYGPQIDRPSYYAQTTPELWIGDAAWTGIDSKFVGTILAIYAGPVNMAKYYPAEMAALQAEISTYWGTP